MSFVLSRSERREQLNEATCQASSSSTASGSANPIHHLSRLAGKHWKNRGLHFHVHRWKHGRRKQTQEAPDYSQ